MALTCEVNPITWNTRREYTVHGQRIAAARVSGGIVFVDIDRGIDGFIARPAHAEAWDFSPAAIMEAYDANIYTGDSYRFPAVRAQLEKLAKRAQYDGNGQSLRDDSAGPAAGW
jgi:hypothetical protein